MRDITAYKTLDKENLFHQKIDLEQHVRGLGGGGGWRRRRGEYK